LADLLFSHADNFDITVFLSAQPAPVTSFNTILFVDTLANSTLTGFDNEVAFGSNGSKYVQIATAAEMTAANDASAGSISAAAIVDVTGALTHSKSPSSVYLLAVDIVGGDAYTTIFATLDDALSDYYAVIPVSHALQDIADVSTGVIASMAAARKRIIVGQSDDANSYAVAATWDADPVGALAETTKDRIYQCFHVDAQPCAAGVASWALSWNPDQYSPPWTFPVPSIAKLSLPSGTTTTTFKTNLDDNDINHPLPLAGTDVYIDPGKSQSGRPFYVIITADWFEARLNAALQTLKVLYASMGQKLPMNTIGQQLVLNEIEALYERGVAAGHFLSRDEAAAQGVDVVIRAETITDDDKSNQELRFTVIIPVLLDARILTLDVTIQQ